MAHYPPLGGDVQAAKAGPIQHGAQGFCAALRAGPLEEGMEGRPVGLFRPLILRPDDRAQPGKRLGQVGVELAQGGQNFVAQTVAAEAQVLVGRVFAPGQLVCVEIL